MIHPENCTKEELVYFITHSMFYDTADIIDCGWSIEENCDHGCPLGRAACVREK